MRLIFFLFLFATHTLFADLNITDRVSKIISNLANTSPDIESKEKKEVKVEKPMTKKEILEKKKREAELKKQRLAKEKWTEFNRKKTNLLKDLEAINAYLQKNSIWANVYSNHETYKSLEFTLTNLKSRIDNLEKKSKLTKKEKKALKKYKDDYKTTKGTIIQLKEYKEEPFKTLLAPKNVGKVPEVLSPLNIISAINFQKHLRNVEEDYNSRFIALKEIVSKLYDKNRILAKLVVLSDDMNISHEEYNDEISSVSKKINTYNRNLKIFETTQNALVKDISDKRLKIQSYIKKEAEKGIIIGATILFLLLIFFFIKYLVRKYMSENELFYTTNKALNFVFITIVFFILLFSYLENVDHLVSILGFASAGIAIALKDWFMSIMGWVVIIFSGSIHVGDRIKVAKDGNQYVGDVVDISLLRMTLHEDVTLTTDKINRRAGRILFVPNNYIFTDMIANYSHSGLKTVWDGIDFMITFDSDVVKAQSIAKEVSRKYSKGYTDMTRKQLNRLRSKYSMRNTSVEPRIFAFLDENGVRISVWYLTNAYATLTLRSTISMEILSRIREEDRISIAFPSQSIYLDKVAPKELKSKSDIFKDKFNKEHGNEPKSRYKPDDWGLY
ncbi:MscS family mechanosensitive ion channel [hydrothermal vent metagenome]|uniref:MscS family mechanosensitive ion channel n=1 Tax=hydrothermal vent metagenome TaxID=652676 RepID=A0A1W1BV42_9ZZZZ